MMDFLKKLMEFLGLELKQQVGHLLWRILRHLVKLMTQWLVLNLDFTTKTQS